MKVKGPAGRKCLQKGGKYNLPFLIHACYSLLKKSSESLFIAFHGRNDRIMMLLYGRALGSPSAHIICPDCSATSLVLRHVSPLSPLGCDNARLILGMQAVFCSHWQIKQNSARCSSQETSRKRPTINGMMDHGEVSAIFDHKLSISETSTEKLQCTNDEHPDEEKCTNDEHPDEEKCTNEETMGSEMTSLETISISPSPDHCPLSILVNLTPDSKAPVASGKAKPEYAAVHAPASKERVRASRKHKCIYDETIVIPNKYSRI